MGTVMQASHFHGRGQYHFRGVIVKSRLLAAVAVLLAGVPTPGAAQRHERLIARIDSLAAEALRRGRAPGLSLAVQRGKELILARGYGHSRRDDSTRATERTVYPVGSITKTFTAAAILRLVEQKKLRLKDPVSSYLPELPPASPPVTVQHLLNHTSGFPLLESIEGAAPTGVIAPGQLVGLLGSVTERGVPGERFRYSNAGYYLLGLITERVTGTTFFDHLARELFRPLQMEGTVDCVDAPAVATGYDSTSAPVPPAALQAAPAYAAAGACSTALDLATWHRALQQNKVVNRRSWGLMTDPTELKDGSRVNYGLGVFLGRLGRHRSVTHGGARPGFSAHVALYPDADLVVAVLANSDQAPTRRLADQIAALVLGVVEPEIRDRTLTPAEMSRYAGVYDLEPPLRVYAGPQRLRAVIGGGSELELLYQGSHEFIAESDPTLRLVFRVSGGLARSVLFRVGNLDVVAKRSNSAQ